MRQLVTWLFLLLATPVAMAQNNIGLRPLVLPLNPTANEAISLLFHAAGNDGREVSHAFTRTGNSLVFNGCYFQSGLQSPQSFRDTVYVGRLAPGTYKVHFIGITSSRAQLCDELWRDTATITFQVRAALAVKTPKAAGWAAYPVPTTSRSLSLDVPNEHIISSLQLLDIAGREVFASPASLLLHQGSSWQVNLPNLPAGTYTLKSLSASGELTAQRVILQ